MEVNKRIAKLRSLMKVKGISAYIAPSSDPHLSEYIPDCWKFRAWLSGFTGSAGTLIVTNEKSALWTDSRYFLQAENELAGSGIELCKMGLPETLTLEAWLEANLDTNDVVGFDGRLLSHSMAKAIIYDLDKRRLRVDGSVDIIDEIWTERPLLPKQKAFEHELRFAGQTVGEKLMLIRKEIDKLGADACIIPALDEVAWTFNIRGNDIEYNPVVLSWGYVSANEAILFIDNEKIDPLLAIRLEAEGVEIIDYYRIEKFIKSIPKNTTIALDESKTNHRLASIIPKKVYLVNTISIPTKLKAIKNPVELENMRLCHRIDGTVMCNFFHWLESSVDRGGITEVSIAEKLKEFRSKQLGFVSESFGTIAGYREHGAIVHYSANSETDVEIKPEGFLLVDSGGQYLMGTTDITRTVHLGTPTIEERIDYTLVLKGMIQVSMIQFPSGTRGTQLDVLARMAMWKKNVNYGHGTGHGVGAFLNVHEGPQSIRPNENPVTLEPGMIQSNEPGIYRAGKYGIRIENLIACQKTMESDFGNFYGFETLTLCPIDTKPIELGMLTLEEREWLNTYHQCIYEQLSPLLNIELQEWLKNKTKPI